MMRLIAGIVGACLGSIGFAGVMSMINPQTEADLLTFGTVGACMGGIVAVFWGKPKI